VTSYQGPGRDPGLGYLVTDEDGQVPSPAYRPGSGSKGSTSPQLQPALGNQNKGERGSLKANNKGYYSQHGESPTNQIAPPEPGPPISTGNSNSYLGNFWSSSKGLTKPPEAVGGLDFNDYEIDFYGEKNYEYIDTEESEDLKKIFEVNRKLGEKYSADLEKMELEFEPIDYQNYEFAEVGLLDFR
jgi:hypothetical protein